MEKVDRIKFYEGMPAHKAVAAVARMLWEGYEVNRRADLEQQAKQKGYEDGLQLILHSCVADFQEFENTDEWVKSVLVRLAKNSKW